MLGLAWPVIGENLLQTLLGVVDTILVAGLGAVALAGVGAALQVIFVVIAALSALSVGAAVLVAQAFGAGDLAAARRFARQSLIWSALVSIPLTLIGLPLVPTIVGLFGLQNDVAQVAASYLYITIGTIVTLTTALIGGGVLRGIGDSRTPMLTTALSNLINVFLAYGLIYGHFGLPELGAVGSAWATFIARLVGALLLIGVLWRGRNGVRIGGPGTWWPQMGIARKVLRIGLPAALEEVLIIGAFATLTPVVASLGTVGLAAHRVVINALSLSFLPGIGFGLATTALVGQAIGARRLGEVQAITRIALRWAMIWMGALGLWLSAVCAAADGHVHRRPADDRERLGRDPRGGAGAAAVGRDLRLRRGYARHRQHADPAADRRRRHLVGGRAGLPCAAAGAAQPGGALGGLPVHRPARDAVLLVGLAALEAAARAR